MPVNSIKLDSFGSFVALLFNWKFDYFNWITLMHVYFRTGVLINRWRSFPYSLYACIRCPRFSFIAFSVAPVVLLTFEYILACLNDIVTGETWEIILERSSSRMRETQWWEPKYITDRRCQLSPRSCWDVFISDCETVTAIDTHEMEPLNFIWTKALNTHVINCMASFLKFIWLNLEIESQASFVRLVSIAVIDISVAVITVRWLNRLSFSACLRGPDTVSPSTRVLAAKNDGI